MLSDRTDPRAEFIPRVQRSNVNSEQYVLLVAEVDRLSMINRELIKENDALQRTKGPISVEKVERLLAENEKLNIIVNQLSKEMNLAQSNAIVNEDPQNKVNILLAEIERLHELLRQQSEPLSVKLGQYQSNQPFILNSQTQGLSTQPQSITMLPQETGSSPFQKAQPQSLELPLHEESGFFTRDQSLGNTGPHSTTRPERSGVQSGMVTDIRAGTPENSVADLSRVVILENENDALRKELTALKAGESQQSKHQKERIIDPKQFDELTKRVKELEPQAIELVEAKKKCVLLGVGFERQIAENKLKDKEIERLNKTLKQTEIESKRALDYERVYKERLEKEIERLQKRDDDKNSRKSPPKVQGSFEIEKQNTHLKKELDEAAFQLEQLREKLLIVQADNERINHMLILKDKELDVLRPKIFELMDKDSKIEALETELIKSNGRKSEFRRSVEEPEVLIRETLSKDELIENLEEKDRQINVLEKDVDDLIVGYNELEDLKQKFEDQSIEITRLQQELDARDQKIEILIRKQKEHKGKVASLTESSTADLRAELAWLRTQFDQVVQERDSMVEALNYKDKEIASLGEYLNNLNDSVLANSVKNIECKDQFEKYSGDIDKLQIEINRRNSANEELVQENKTLRKTADDMEKMRDKVLGIMTKRDVEIEALTKLLDEVFPELKVLKEQKSELAQENMTLRKAANDLEKVRDKVLGIMTKRDVEIEGLMQLFDETFSELKALREQKNELLRDNKALQKTTVDLEKMRDKVLGIMTKRDVEIEGLTKVLDDIFPELKALREQKDELAQVNAEQDMENESLIRENMDLRLKCEGLEANRSELENKYKQLERLYIEARGATEDVEKIHGKLMNVCNLTEEADPNVINLP